MWNQGKWSDLRLCKAEHKVVVLWIIIKCSTGIDQCLLNNLHLKGRQHRSHCYIFLIKNDWLIWLMNPLECFFGIEGHVALDRNQGPGYNTQPLQLIPSDL